MFWRKNFKLIFATNLYLLATQLPFPFQFYGNSTSAILEGVATISLLPRGEEYVMTLPYAHCKGILMGTMTMELGGKVSIECAKTGYAADLEFKLRVRILSDDLLFYLLVSRGKGWNMETRLYRFWRKNNQNVSLFFQSFYLEPYCCKKQQKSPCLETGLGNRGVWSFWMLPNWS